MLGFSTLSDLARLRDFRSRRASSYDRSGGNRDWQEIAPGETVQVMEADHPGCIKHIWMTVGNDDTYPRKAVIRMYWDDQDVPAVEVPLGDFFGMGHGMMKEFVSLPLQMSPQDGRGMNCWWAMPFDSARIEIENQGDRPINVYFYIDYEEYFARLDEGVARFHAWWNRENPTEGWLTERLNNDNVWDIWARNPNTTGEGNYTILETTGNGVYVGCHLHIDCFHRQGNDWYGEGDDMIFVDGESWPPKLHGTGTEDYFNMAFCPRTEYCAPYHGLILYSGNSEWPWKGKNSMYRYHIEDPIRFRESIRVTIEHGHANKLWNDYSSTAYWYQMGPTPAQPKLPPVAERLPRSNEPTFP